MGMLYEYDRDARDNINGVRVPPHAPPDVEHVTVVLCADGSTAVVVETGTE